VLREGPLGIGGGRAQRRDATPPHRDEQRHAEGEEQHRRVDRDVGAPGHARGRQGQQRVDSPARHEDAHDAGGGGEKPGLG
jgi:hypothetical protein